MRRAHLKLAALIVWAAAGGAGAKAADISSAAALHDWTGYYIGAQAELDWLNAQEAEPFNLPSASMWGGGLNVQSLWQRQNLVFGAVAHANLLGGSNTGACEAGGSDFQCNYGASWDASVRAKVGLAADRFMLFGTAGWGWTDNRLSVTYHSATEWDLKTLGGWVAGGGVSFAITDKWSSTIEYLHYDLGSGSAKQQVAFGTSDVRPVSDTVMLGLDYKF